MGKRINGALFRRIINKLHCQKGLSESFSLIFVISVFILFAGAGITIWGQLVKLDNLQQIAQSMARTITLDGRVNSSTHARLEELERLMNMDVDMRVDGEFVGNTDKLRLESDFTVTITYRTKYGVGWINWGREKTYAKTATGTAEEYHK